MAQPRLGSFRNSLAQRSKHRLLSHMDSDWDPARAPLLPSFLNEDDDDDAGNFFRKARLWVSKVRERALEIAGKIWGFARSDPRKVVFSAKMGLALMLLSFLIFLKEPFDAISSHCVWAIITVVVVFEFSIGATLSKGFNRGLGTLLAGGLALGIAELAVLAGGWEEFIIILSIYLAGFLSSFLKLYPTMKPYEYGFRVFLITFCFIVVSGFRTGAFTQTAITRFFLICVGASVALAVNIFIYPIWAGEDLHNLVAKNFTNVAQSLEACVDGYLKCFEYVRVPSKILTYEASDDPLYKGYRAAVESKAQEDALLGFAVWEPPHGPYKMLRYPWKSYIKVSGALRHCAFAVMAMHGCVLSEIQAPPARRHVFKRELQRVGKEGAKVLREIGEKVSTMKKLAVDEDILSEVMDAVEELQKKIDTTSYLLVNSERWEIGTRRDDTESVPDDLEHCENNTNHIGVKSHSEAVLEIPRSWDAPDVKYISIGSANPKLDSQESRTSKLDAHAPPRPTRQGLSYDDDIDEESKTYESASALSLATFASLLIEFVARLSYLVESFEDLSEVAKFQ